MPDTEPGKQRRVAKRQQNISANEAPMMNNVLKYCVLTIALLAPAAAYSANGIGSVTGTTTPEVVTPQMSAPPQTPAQPSPPIGTTGFVAVQPSMAQPAPNHMAPTVVRPPAH